MRINGLSTRFPIDYHGLIYIIIKFWMLLAWLRSIFKITREQFNQTFSHLWLFNQSYMNLQKLFEWNVNIYIPLCMDVVCKHVAKPFTLPYSLFLRMTQWKLSKAWEIERSKMRTYPELCPRYKFLYEIIVE